MSLTGNENHDISLTEAAHLTENYRNAAGTSATIAHYFGGAAIQAILEQEGCVGIRIYYGLKDDGEKQLVITGVNSAGNDLYNGLLAERSLNCPTNCSASNPLNS